MCWDGLLRHQNNLLSYRLSDTSHSNCSCCCRREEHRVAVEQKSAWRRHTAQLLTVSVRFWLVSDRDRKKHRKKAGQTQVYCTVCQCKIRWCACSKKRAQCSEDADRFPPGKEGLCLIRNSARDCTRTQSPFTQNLPVLPLSFSSSATIYFHVQCVCARGSGSNRHTLGTRADTRESLESIKPLFYIC